MKDTARSIAPVLLLVTLGVLVYSNSLGGKFIRDDSCLITDNSVIKDRSNLAGIFTKPNISTTTGKTFHFYRPVQILTYMADYSFCKLRPRGYHVTNIILHILASLALYRLVNILFRDKFLSLVTSALFIVHPVHAEAVAYISGRADPLSTFFLLISFILYIRCLDKGSPVLYVSVFITYVLALLSRENVIILPVLLLVYHYSFRKKVRLSLFLPVVFVAVLYIAARLTVLKGLLPDYNLLHETAALQRVPGFFVAVVNYIKVLLLPLHLHIEYGDKVFKFTDPAAVAGILIVASLLVSAFMMRKRSALTFFSIMWFIVTLLPVSNVYPVGAYMAEHWLYLPSIGLFLIASSGLESLCKMKNLKAASVGTIAMLIILYSYLTFKQNDYWKDPLPFYERTQQYAPDSMRANNDLAIAYQKEGRYDEAITIYEDMLRIDPKHPNVYVNLAAIYIILGKSEKAIELCNKAIGLEPNNATAHNNLAVAYYTKGRYDLAIKHCDLAIRYGYKVKQELFNLLEPHRGETIAGTE